MSFFVIILSISSYLIIRFHAPAIIEKPILIQKQDRKKEKQRRRPGGDENMRGTNGENSKIVMNQYMTVDVEKEVTFSSPNRSETVRARYRANGTFHCSSKLNKKIEIATGVPLKLI